MKFILLAAAAVIATPVLAQDQTTPPADPAAQTAPATPDASTAAPATDPNAAPMATAPAQTDPNAAPMATAPAQTTPDASATGQTAPTGDASAADPAGGYQPTSPAISGTATPGQPVQFQQAPSPSQAFPPPPPMDSYPTCKKGQYDNCKQASGGGHSTRHRAVRRKK